MSKNKASTETVERTSLANPKGKTVEELKEIAITLQAQKNQHQEKVQEAQVIVNKELTMVAKAQGALEVVLQMIPKEEVDKMIQMENSENGAAVEG